MKLLFLLQELPFPPSNGFRRKIFGLLSHMGQEHRCDVLAIGTPEDLRKSEPWVSSIPGLHILGVYPPDRVPFLELRQFGTLLLTSDSPSWLRYRSAGLVQAIRRALRENTYDLAHVDLQGMASFCRILKPMKIVLSLNDAMSLTFLGTAANRYASWPMRAASFARAWPQMRIDRAMFGLADAVHFVGSYDAEWCRRRLGASNAVYVPLAVDGAFLSVTPKRDRGGVAGRIVIVDKLWAAQHRNAVAAFLSRQWPALQGKFPDARLTVIGGMGMPDSFKRLAGSLPGVELHEWVERLEDLLAETSIAVFPYSVAVGMKTRVLECMAAMNVVVGTPNAFLGLPVEHGKHVFIAESLDGIAQGIGEILSSETMGAAMGEAAREVVHANFGRERVGKAWECLYEDIIHGKAPKLAYL